MACQTCWRRKPTSGELQFRFARPGARVLLCPRLRTQPLGAGKHFDCEMIDDEPIARPARPVRDQCTDGKPTRPNHTYPLAGQRAAAALAPGDGQPICNGLFSYPPFTSFSSSICAIELFPISHTEARRICRLVSRMHQVRYLAKLLVARDG